ncbi:hypothetical protein HK28_02020 [Acetobacter sp. DsW_063]|nr:hypothetical protein HK28_02020 [Acetobacter sp. DsW_063]
MISLLTMLRTGPTQGPVRVFVYKTVESPPVPDGTIPVSSRANVHHLHDARKRQVDIHPASPRLS